MGRFGAGEVSVSVCTSVKRAASVPATTALNMRMGREVVAGRTERRGGENVVAGETESEGVVGERGSGTSAACVGCEPQKSWLEESVSAWMVLFICRMRGVALGT
jgi:hypothetical protein